MVVVIQMWLCQRSTAVTHSSREQLQASEGHVLGYSGQVVVRQHRDGDEPKVDQEGENVQQEQRLEEQEVGEDAGAEPAPDLLHGALPQGQGLPGGRHPGATPTERLEGQYFSLTWLK